MGGRSRARRAALAALVAVEEGEFLDGALRTCDRVAGADRRERALARRIVRGTLQMRGRLDEILRRTLTAGDPSSLDRWTRNTLRLGVYQIVHLSGVPPHAAVDETVRLARARGGGRAAGLVNAVLRTLLREGVPPVGPSLEDDPVAHLAAAESYPEWLVARWVRRLGVSRAAARLRAGNRAPPIGLRVLPGGAVDAVAAEIARSGRAVERSGLHPSLLLLTGGGDPRDLAPFRRGAILVQGEGAALASSAAGVVPAGARLLDLCAAPGGKLFSLAAASPHALFLGVDLSASRLGRAAENRERLRLDRVRLVRADGLAPPVRNRSFRVVLADVPCSGLGTLARRADLRWRVREEEIARLASLAGRLLRAAAAAVEPGGCVVYSTCTTEPEENEEVVRSFLEEERCFRLVPPEAPFPAEAIAPDGTVRVLPEVHGSDGAFAARLRRDRA